MGSRHKSCAIWKMFSKPVQNSGEMTVWVSSIFVQNTKVMITAEMLTTFQRRLSSKVSAECQDAWQGICRCNRCNNFWNMIIIIKFPCGILYISERRIQFCLLLVLTLIFKSLCCQHNLVIKYHWCVKVTKSKGYIFWMNQSKTKRIQFKHWTTCISMCIQLKQLQ